MPGSRARVLAMLGESQRLERELNELSERLLAFTEQLRAETATATRGEPDATPPR